MYRMFGIVPGIKRKLLAILFTVVAASSVPATTPEVKIEYVASGGADSIRVAVRFYQLPNIGAISLKIKYDETVMQFGRIAQVNQLINDYISSDINSIITFAWDSVLPVNLSNQPAFELIFRYNGSSTQLMFDTTMCEIADNNFNRLPVLFTNLHLPVTGIEEQHSAVAKFEVAQNYPNPFNPVTRIHYRIPESGTVAVKVIDMSGKEVFLCKEQYLSAGEYTKAINASNLSSGIYLYTLEFIGFTQKRYYRITKKMNLIK